MVKGSVEFQGCLGLGDGVSGVSRLFLVQWASWSTNMSTIWWLELRVISGLFITIMQANRPAEWRFDFIVTFESGRKVKGQLKENREIYSGLGYRVIGAQEKIREKHGFFCTLKLRLAAFFTCFDQTPAWDAKAPHKLQSSQTFIHCPILQSHKVLSCSVYSETIILCSISLQGTKLLRTQSQGWHFCPGCQALAWLCCSNSKEPQVVENYLPSHLFSEWVIPPCSHCCRTFL